MNYPFSNYLNSCFVGKNISHFHQMIIYKGKYTSFCKIISWRDDPNGVSLYLSTPRGNLILLFASHVKAYLYMKISQPHILIYTCPDGAKGRASAREGEVGGSNPGRAIPKALKMVPVATLFGDQHYKASTSSSLTHY